MAIISVKIRPKELEFSKFQNDSKCLIDQHFLTAIDKIDKKTWRIRTFFDGKVHFLKKEYKTIDGAKKKCQKLYEEYLNKKVEYIKDISHVL